MFDHMAYDGLEDAYDKTPNGGGRSMGTFAEDCAGKYEFTPRSAGQVRDRIVAPRARRQRGRLVQVGDRAGHGRRPQGRHA